MKNRKFSNLRKSIILIAVIFSAPNIFATESGNSPIISFLGQKFGAKFNTANSKMEELPPNLTGYTFSPEKIFRNFSKCYVLLTPKTRRIYGVYIQSKAETQSKADDEHRLCVKILEKKYRLTAKKENADFASEYHVIKFRNGLFIIATPIGLTKFTTSIICVDNKMVELYGKEKYQLEMEKTDTSML